MYFWQYGLITLTINNSVNNANAILFKMQTLSTLKVGNEVHRVQIFHEIWKIESMNSILALVVMSILSAIATVLCGVSTGTSFYRVKGDRCLVRTSYIQGWARMSSVRDCLISCTRNAVCASYQVRLYNCGSCAHFAATGVRSGIALLLCWY